MISCEKLTPCEKEVLEMKAAGMPSRDIAAERKCSKRTIDFHLANIYKKLRVRNAIRALNEARRLGAID